MSSFRIVLVLISCYFLNNSKMKAQQEAIAIYGFWHHTEPDGSPSECDCQYLKKELFLFGDGSFKLIKQKGRLSPKYESKFGIWDIVDDKLHLSVQQREFRNIDNQLMKEEYYGSVTFTKVMNHSITDNDDQWKYYSGLRPVELFEKYNKK